MDSYETLVQTLALTLGVGWASGINLYAAVFMLGYMQANGHVALPAELQVLSDPLILAAAGFMYFLEFFADKTPGVDTVWDVLHTFIRLPAGAVLAASAIGDVAPAAQIAAGLVGGTLAATSHSLKAGGRVLINTSPEPVTNWTASVGEDALVVAGLWTALTYPWVFIVALLLFIAVAIWLLPKIARGIRALGRRAMALFGQTRRLPPP